MSGDVNFAQKFKNMFMSMVNEQGYSRDDVYNADETGVNWRSLPRKSLTSRRESSLQALNSVRTE